MLSSRISRAALAAIALLSTAGTASAHHVMGGGVPSTFAQGLLSGLGHPVIGADHLAFLIALGIAVGIAGLSLATPIVFLVAMAAGVAAHVAGWSLPASEAIVALSVLAVGILLATDRRMPAAGWMALFLIAGFFHGYAFGESIYGAESTPLIAYLVGLVAVQSALTIGIAVATRTTWKLSAIAPRLAGAAVGGVGFAALMAQIIPTPGG